MHIPAVQSVCFCQEGMDVIQFKPLCIYSMIGRETKLHRADHTQQQQTGWLVWLTVCKTSKYDDKKRKEHGTIQATRQKCIVLRKILHK